MLVTNRWFFLYFRLPSSCSSSVLVCMHVTVSVCVCIHIHIYLCVYPVRVGAHMTCSTFILIYKAGGEHHHRIASSSLLYYTTFVFILLPRPGWIHYRFPMGLRGPATPPRETMGWRGGISEHASSLEALALFWLQNIITGLSLFSVLAG